MIIFNTERKDFLPPLKPREIFERDGLVAYAGHVSPDARAHIFTFKEGRAIYTGTIIHSGISRYIRNPQTGNYGEYVMIGNFTFYNPKVWEFRIIETQGRDKKEVEREFSEKGWEIEPTSRYLDQAVVRRRITQEEIILKDKFEKSGTIFRGKRRKRRRFRKRRCSLCRMEYRKTGKRATRCNHIFSL
ncbi:MAG: hypothetical protein UR81_C0010G0001 [Candidatus Levybacteria bacterium GW2011_GWB1_35_5]|nr:MAG: hypothetical protein UR81_C0010G0001 [Candidatus Levybacteria bacterium GW2011_GWB1_35_5]